MKTLMLALTILAVPLGTSARIMSGWTYQDMLDKSDLVVVAEPTDTKQTAETAILPGISPEVHVVGTETTFEVSATLKGDKETKTLRLHHYRFADPSDSTARGRPELATFDPKAKQHFLLFLVRESDGRYAPATGQTDPADFSVLELKGVAQ